MACQGYDSPLTHCTGSRGRRQYGRQTTHPHRFATNDAFLSLCVCVITSH